MKKVFKVGDQKLFRKIVESADIAAFSGMVVHPVYSTFALARDVEWATRQFVIDMRDEDEEGIGTLLTIEHTSPAFMGEEVVFTSTIDGLNDHEVLCSYKVEVGERLIARGKTGQKILKKDKIERLLLR
jgi:fluoroacetyl-CoA thioesterase